MIRYCEKAQADGQYFRICNMEAAVAPKLPGGTVGLVIAHKGSKHMSVPPQVKEGKLVRMLDRGADSDAGKPETEVGKRTTALSGYGNPWDNVGRSLVSKTRLSELQTARLGMTCGPWTKGRERFNTTFPMARKQEEETLQEYETLLEWRTFDGDVWDVECPGVSGKTGVWGNEEVCELNYIAEEEELEEGEISVWQESSKDTRKGEMRCGGLIYH
ncbi:hypothetical protein NDU88_001355 [Pleurodeles waltl]|uniref:Uncharacterized protein n=1 Tax=Pleurodeles waltl TaxID=8319 RepID=A0AAV7Q3S3_PLEWA|nr:hypothetical protein NDU88_001355 [Pleurodeles waltl]